VNFQVSGNNFKLIIGGFDFKNSCLGKLKFLIPPGKISNLGFDFFPAEYQEKLIRYVLNELPK
jgi:hypothetical protein